MTMAKKTKNFESFVVISLLVLLAIVAIIATRRITNPQALNTTSRADEIDQMGRQVGLPSCVSELYFSLDAPTPGAGINLGYRYCTAAIVCNGAVKELINTDALHCRQGRGSTREAICSINKDAISQCMPKEWWMKIAAQVCGCKQELETTPPWRGDPRTTPPLNPHTTPPLY